MRVYPQRPRTWVKWAKGILVAELALFGVAYYHFDKLAREQDYRHHMHEKHPNILALYYWSKEGMHTRIIGGQHVSEKEMDCMAWGIPFTK